MPGPGLIEILLYTIPIVLAVIIFWKIIGKTGRSGALALLGIIPLVNIGLLLWLAFSEWPIEREIRALRQQTNGAVDSLPE